MKFATTLATTMLMAVQSQLIDVEQETNSLWTLPFDKIVPQNEFPDDPASEPDPVTPDPDPVSPDTEPVTEPVTEPATEPVSEPDPVDPEPEEPTDNYPDENRDAAVTTFDGHCVGCIAAGYIFCMDGNSINAHHTVQEFGSCQPDAIHCTNNNHPDWNFSTREEFAQCDYQGVKEVDTEDEAHVLNTKVYELEVTPEEANKLLEQQNDLETLPVLLDLYLAEDAYQFIHVINNAGDNVDELELGFKGGVDETYTQTTETDLRQL